MSGRGSTVSERYRPTTNEKPSETMFQRVLLDFVLKTFGLVAENETRTRLRGQFSRTIFTPPNPLRGGILGSLVRAIIAGNTKQKRQLGSCLSLFWSGKRDSNSRPQPWQGCALPTELFPHYFKSAPRCYDRFAGANIATFLFPPKLFAIFFDFLLLRGDF